MKIARLSNIIIPEGRFRKEFPEKKLADIRASVMRIGLLNPITVEIQGDNFILRAGECRLRVLTSILESGDSFRCGLQEFSGNSIPVIDFAELTELQRLEVEVEENVLRSDFSWQERTRALAALHELRKAQNPQQTVAATATEVLGKPAVGDQRMVVSNALIVAKHLDDPDVAKAKDERAALKVIRKKTEAAHNARLAINFDGSSVQHTMLNDDARHALSKMQSETFDVVVTDPPYGIGADRFGDMSGTGHDYGDSKAVFDDLASWLPDELFRVTKPAAHTYIFCDHRNFEQLHTLMVLAGWTAFHTPLIWDKCGTGMLPFPDNGPRRTHECILYAWKGNRKVLKVKNDVIRVPAVKGLEHGAQKPVALFQDLLGRSARPGDVVLDCFGGSGTILVAANNMSLTATYIEKSKEFFDAAIQRSLNTGFDDGVEEEDGIEVDL